MKKNVSNLYFFSSICFYIAALLSFKNDQTFFTMYLCLGSTMMCIGALQLNKTKNKK